MVDENARIAWFFFVFFLSSKLGDFFVCGRLYLTSKGVESIFPGGGPAVDFSSGSIKIFSWGGNNGEFSFNQLQTMRKTYCCF